MAGTGTARATVASDRRRWKREEGRRVVLLYGRVEGRGAERRPGRINERGGSKGEACCFHSAPSTLDAWPAPVPAPLVLISLPFSLSLQILWKSFAYYEYAQRVLKEAGIPNQRILKNHGLKQSQEPREKKTLPWSSSGSLKLNVP